MKHLALLLLTALLVTNTLFGQYRKSTPVKAGEDVAKAFSPQGFYRFDQFGRGILYSRQASGSSGQPFNYDILSDRMQFISRQGDTLEMTNPAVFDSVKIDDRLFYYNSDLGFVELVAASGSARLVKKVSIKIKPQAVGGYGTSTSTSAVNKMHTFVISTNIYSCKINEDVMIKESIDWYWMSRQGDLVKATKKNLLSILPADKKTVAESFIRQNDTEFDREDDLAKLISSL